MEIHLSLSFFFKNFEKRKGYNDNDEKKECKILYMVYEIHIKDIILCLPFVAGTSHLREYVNNKGPVYQVDLLKY